MSYCELILIDACELRAAAYGELLAPFAGRHDIELYVVSDVEELGIIPVRATKACVYSIGHLSLHDLGVQRTILRLQSLFPDISIIVFEDICDTFEIAIAIDCGLRGLIPTTMPPKIALAAIQFILNGGTYHPHATTGTGPLERLASARLRHAVNHEGESTEAPVKAEVAKYDLRQVLPICKLSRRPPPPEQGSNDGRRNALTKKRHLEVLEFLVRGETNKEIARHLNLTEATIKVYVRELMRHFNAKNRMQVAIMAAAHDRPDTRAEPFIPNIRESTANWPNSRANCF